MQKAFSNYLDKLTDKTSSHQNRVFDLQQLSRCIRVTIEEIQEWLDAIKELARKLSKWLIRYTTIHIIRYEEIILIIIAAKSYKVELEKKTKGK